MRKGSLISVFSGSTGTILPEVDAIEVSFEAEWQRSLYLALRFFSIPMEEVMEVKAITFVFQQPNKPAIKQKVKRQNCKRNIGLCCG